MPKINREEYESEETEVKKDLDWVIQEINTTRKVLADSESSGNETADDFTFNNGKEAGLVNALKLLDQLDEPEVTHEQVVEWIGNNEFYCHVTAETVLENTVDKGELGYYGTKYSVVKKEPETVASVFTDFLKSSARLKEVMSMEVEELEE